MSTKGGGSVKSLPAMQETRVEPWVGRSPWRRKWQPTTVFFAWEIPWTEEHGRLHSPWGHKESDMTEPLSLPKGGNHVKS